MYIYVTYRYAPKAYRYKANNVCVLWLQKKSRLDT